ncbi:hypothetical protein N1851_012850 [Merluccius polli]|nr:hypothetical protein N1851_029609 [Merluccius polli]KAK0138646.1 hypothetical protein N1851_024834 [Merluccius polli]KAK0146102.1 hypothetical protein N1851_014638 [Merluccius polli]KAK0147660.1 hypothetical protein N1851_012850 [Merluccius polli]
MACRYAVVGAVDGTHIKIIAPSKDDDVFWPAGSTHDSCILMENGLRQLFERHHVPLGVNCWVTVAIPARHLDTLSQSTTGSTVKSTQKYTKCCGERNWADEMSISCPAQRNTPEPREGK